MSHRALSGRQHPASPRDWEGRKIRARPHHTCLPPSNDGSAETPARIDVPTPTLGGTAVYLAELIPPYCRSNDDDQRPFQRASSEHALQRTRPSRILPSGKARMTAHRAALAGLASASVLSSSARPSADWDGEKRASLCPRTIEEGLRKPDTPCLVTFFSSPIPDPRS